MQKARGHPTKGLPPLVGVWFQALFTPLLAVLFTFPSQYLFTIGLPVVFSLAGWCRRIQTGFLRSRLTQDTNPNNRLLYKGLSPAMATFSKRVLPGWLFLMLVLQPLVACNKVWANPLSLATTCGITIVFSSSGYLDVSVPRVVVPCGTFRLHRNRLPHSDICGSKVVCASPQLFAAYHVLRHLWEPRHPPYALLCFLLFDACKNYEHLLTHS